MKESKPEAKEEKAASQPVAAQPAATNTVFTLKSEQKFAANEPKVLGKIDLSTLNQSTRPKKKTKEERRKARTTITMAATRTITIMVAARKRIKTRIRTITTRAITSVR